jgi:hypothetical protein
VKHVVLDAGALIALDRGAAEVRGYVLLADRDLVALSTSAAVVAQVWRGDPRQARLTRLLDSDLLNEVSLDLKDHRVPGHRVVHVLKPRAFPRDVLQLNPPL